MSSSQIFIVRDDRNNPGFVYGGGVWKASTSTLWFGGQTIYPAFAKTRADPQGVMSMTFHGTSLAIVGNSPAGADNQRFVTAIDGDLPYNTTTGDNNPQRYLQWYQSPTLPSGQHTIRFSDLGGNAVDYMTITPGPDTDLTGETLMVDDYYTGIKYAGSWEGVTSEEFDKGGSASVQHGFTFQNSTHQTTTVGDSFSFTFSGTSASVWALYHRDQAGNLQITSQIDDGSPLMSTFSSKGTGTTKGQPHFNIVDTGPLQAGKHTIKVTLSDRVGQTLSIDYILYTPNFPSLSQMPNLDDNGNPGSPTAGSSSSPGDSSSTAANKSVNTSVGSSPPLNTSPPNSGSATLVGGSWQTGSSSSPGNTDANGGSASESKTNVAAITGGIVGGLLLLAIIFAFLFLRRKRNAAKEYDSLVTPAILPNMAHQPTTALSQRARASGAHFDSSFVAEPFVGAPPSAAAWSKPNPSSSPLSYYPSTESTPTASPFAAKYPPSVTGSTTSLLATTQRAATPSAVTNGETVEELQHRIQMLTAKNAQLEAMAVPPPYPTQ